MVDLKPRHFVIFLILFYIWQFANKPLKIGILAACEAYETLWHSLQTNVFVQETNKYSAVIGCWNL